MLHDEEKTRDSLKGLNNNFSLVMIDIEEAFDNEIKDNPKLLKKITTWLRYREDLKYHADTIATLNNVSTLADVFTAIRPLFDCTDCALLVNMCQQFIPNAKEEVSKLASHHERAKEFCRSTTVKQLKDDLEKIYRPHLATNFKNMPKIVVKLQNKWLDVKEEMLHSFIRKLLPIKSSQSLIDYIDIIPGSVTIIYYVQDCTADMLKEHLQTKMQFMRLIGIFSLYINDQPVLQEDENMNFTFELALLEAVTAGNNEAVEFLLQLETVNIDHTNEEGKTALMLACERGHEDIVHSLQSAGANVDVRSIREWTRVHIMRGSEYIIRFQSFTYYYKLILTCMKILIESNALMQIVFCVF